ncbi:GNAT family N-acetyltransferase [Agrococcus sp. Marseille-Q4369]|uniref:GNAT family N-acetyltransferase n=1 Tax=Agrococcus sp. Marseille-Q4369 TaxID=2810513 RepID=UPI001B8C8C45|nr:GNAT family N-acetyltransferase [Agrococcus sp. Marseille-Q4369]QUW18837.1 GNAT family N-acetyltransferase [Agrococcus sp. Marseille-Q4369]
MTIPPAGDILSGRAYEQPVNAPRLGLPSPADRELDRLYVAAEMHGTGLGAALFDAVVDERPHYLWLIDGNARAARFYERRGFEHLDEQVSTGPTWGGIPMHRMLRR